MKILFVIMLIVTAGFPQKVTVSGQSGMGTYVYWGTATDSSRKILHHAGSVFYDSASLGTVYKRIDNTADSCSRPFWIATDMGTYPNWKYEVETRLRSVDADSGTFVYRVETRFVKDSRKGSYWGWRRKGKLSGTADVTIQDSVIVPAPGVTTKSTVAALFFVTGDQARLCPDEFAGTANAAGDSIFSDTTIVRRQ